jgi:hypothetical protein
MCVMYFNIKRRPLSKILHCRNIILSPNIQTVMSHIKTEKEVFGAVSQFVRDQYSEGSDFEYLFGSCLPQLQFPPALRISYRQALSTFKHITPSMPFLILHLQPPNVSTQSVQLKEYLSALSRVFVEMLIVVMLAQFIGNRHGSGRSFPVFIKAHCRPDSGPGFPIHIHVGSIRLISIFYSYIRSHLQLNVFLDSFQTKWRAYFSLQRIRYVLSPQLHTDLISLSIQHKLYSSAQSSIRAVYKGI